LTELATQETAGLFTYSIVVVDNDKNQSARALVSDFMRGSHIPIKYCVEPQQNISLARNRAVANAAGDFVAFIDDDELPTKRWLITLLSACNEYNVDGVLGPVEPHFDNQPPEWVVKGKFYERATYPTGLVIDWRKGRTGNVLLKRKIFENDTAPFKPELLTGEDQEFFSRMIEKGHVFIWCNEALASEIVPSSRWKRSFMLRRALLRGATSPLQPAFGYVDIVKSIIAVPTYVAAIPVALILGHDRFMSLSVRLFEHCGKLLALLGIKPIKDAYVTD
jgi:glycosyltransferase involved in cell wall biosynthesis